jgi:hypothetical protein
MAIKKISEYPALPSELGASDVILVERGSAGYKRAGDKIVNTDSTQTITGSKTFNNTTTNYTADGSVCQIIITGSPASGTGAQIPMRMSRGSLASPAAVQANDGVRIQSRLHDGTTYQSTGGLIFQATETHSGTVRGTEAIIQTTPTGTTTLTNSLVVPNAGIYNTTTATAANVVITSGNILQRSTSSKKYKKDIEDMSLAEATRIVDAIKPIWYRSKCEADRKDWSYWGVIAEDLAEIDPRLVHWGYWPEDYIEATNDEGEKQLVLKSDAKLSPVGVQYERIAVLLLRVQQADRKRLDDLEKRLAKLEKAAK